MNRSSRQFSNSTVILSIILLVAGYGINPVFAQEPTDIIEAEFILADTVGGVGTTPGKTVAARILRDVPTTAQLDEYFGWTGSREQNAGGFSTCYKSRLSIDGKTKGPLLNYRPGSRA